MNRLLKTLSSLSIRTKLFTLSTVILIASFAVMGYQETTTMTKIIQGEALEKAQSDLQTSYSLIDIKYPGDWKAADGQLYKGETLINNNYEIVDSVGKLTNGDTATIFLGDTRVTTNVLVDGERAIGTKVSEAVADAVLKKGDVYLGQANVVGHTYQSAYMPLKDAQGTIIGIYYVGAPDASERIQQIQRDTTLQIVFEAVIVIVLALLLNFITTRPMIRRIQDAVMTLKSVAAGDLTHRELQVKSHDETGVLTESVNQMVKDLRGILTHVRDTSMLVAASSEQLTASAEQTSMANEQITVAIQEVAQGSEKQLSSVTDARQLVSEISLGMQQSAHLIQTMSDLTTTANEKASMGTQAVTHSIEQMNHIQHTVGATAKVIQALELKAMEIGQIVEVITQIANQTNLLALNAAIEAARAGEDGKGFTIVADEVRKLAEQSGRSADEVRALIEQIQEEFHKAMHAMNQGTEAVQEGIRQVHHSGGVFQDIATAVAEISSQSQGTAAIIDQVHANSQSMVTTMESVALIAQQSSAHTHQVASSAEEQNSSMEEVASSAESLGSMAEELQQIISRFKL